jgi:cytochrome c oxidase assembly protein subunit 15
VLAILRAPATLRFVAAFSVAVNVIIVVTGGLVRLTGSGLGCPTWPRCTDTSYVTTKAMGYHGLIEFGNRTLTSVVSAAAVAAIVVAWFQRDRVPGLLKPALAVLLGVAWQAVVGGVTVHLALNPWTVALHFLGSMFLLAATYVYWHRVTARPGWDAPGPVRMLGLCLLVVSAAVIVLGTVVTGSGPHAGDRKAARTGFDPEAVAQLHTDAVFLLIGLSVALWFAMRALGAPRPVVRTGLTLVIVELAQGAVGFVQYFTGLPAPVVLGHMLGACLVWMAALAVFWSLRIPRIEVPAEAATDPAPEPAPEPAAEPAELVRG